MHFAVIIFKIRLLQNCTNLIQWPLSGLTLSLSLLRAPGLESSSFHEYQNQHPGTTPTSHYSAQRPLNSPVPSAGCLMMSSARACCGSAKSTVTPPLPAWWCWLASASLPLLHSLVGSGLAGVTLQHSICSQLQPAGSRPYTLSLDTLRQALDILCACTHMPHPSSQGTVSSINMSCLVSLDQRTLSGQRLVIVISSGNLSCFFRSTRISQSFAVDNMPLALRCVTLVYPALRKVLNWWSFESCFGFFLACSTPATRVIVMERLGRGLGRGRAKLLVSKPSRCINKQH